MLKLRAIDLDDSARISQKTFRCGFHQPRFTGTGRSQEEKIAYGPARSGHSGQVSLIDTDDLLYGLVLSHNSLAEIRIELVANGQLLVLQEMLAGGPSPVRVVADQDTDVLVIPARVLIDAMEHSQMVARDIGAAA